jgi:hypothetical protein
MANAGLDSFGPTQTSGRRPLDVLLRAATHLCGISIRMTCELETLQRKRKQRIEKLEREISLVQAQCDVFERDDIDKDKVAILRRCIAGMQEALRLLKTVYENNMPEM